LADEITPMLLSWGMKGEHHLMAGSGLLDDTLFNRTRWRYGNRIDRTQMLVADGDDVFGLRIYSGISWNCALHNQGDGYLIFRQNVGKAVPPVPRAERTKRVLNRIPYERYDWHTNIPIRVNAMVLTGAGGGDRRLFVAGLPDVVDPKDPLAAYEGRKGAEFLALSGETGEKLSQLHLPAIPVWDSLIASQGRLYIALQDGSLLCLAGKQ
jgi:hypothetical protein